MKRLIICSDGTWQRLESTYPTNVVKISQAIKPVVENTPQVVFYDEGVGTESLGSKIFGGAFGWGLDKNIQDGYRFLCLNYEPGDEIYLFGFSRGAYTVRSLAGMIYCSGLLRRAQIRHAPEAYDLYRDRDAKPDLPQAEKFKKEHCFENVTITLLACWDTVGSLGVPDEIPGIPIDDWINEKYEFHDTTLSPIIHNALHAVAIDELRKVFDVTPMNKSKHNPAQKLTQVWFPGDHSAIGGGSEAKSGLSDAALEWMIEMVGEYKLGLDFDKRHIPTGTTPDHTIHFDNSLRGIYKALNPKGGFEREITGTFNDLHISVKRRWRDREDYRPQNLKSKFEKELSKWTEP